MKREILKHSTSAVVIAGVLGFAALYVWRVIRKRQKKKTRDNHDSIDDFYESQSAIQAYRRKYYPESESDEDELSLNNSSHGHSMADEYDEIQLKPKPKPRRLSNLIENQGEGVNGIPLQKKTVNKFLKKVQKNKEKFIEYQTLKNKQRRGLSSRLEESKQLDMADSEEEREEYQDECQSLSGYQRALSVHSKLSSQSAPTPYLSETPGGPVVVPKNKLKMRPKDFKKKDDFIFFDLFTLYTESYLGKKKKNESSLILEEEELSELKD